MAKLGLIIAHFVLMVGGSLTLDHLVGDSAWTIPPSQNFYCNWSNTQLFRVGDSLVFVFETNFHDVVQVERREYESCRAKKPIRAFWTGPATVPLNQKGLYYFICTMGNYCLLGQKLSVLVQSSPSPAVPPAMSPHIMLLPPPSPLDQPPMHPPSSAQVMPTGSEPPGSTLGPAVVKSSSDNGLRYINFSNIYGFGAILVMHLLII